MTEPCLIFSVLAAILVLCLPVLLVPLLGRERHKMIRAGLRKRALEASEALVESIEEREAGRPAHNTVVTDHEYPHRCVTAQKSWLQNNSVKTGTIGAGPGLCQPPRFPSG